MQTEDVADRLSRGGFLAPREEAEQLIEAAQGSRENLENLVARRLTGEPLAWITGLTIFCDLELRIHAGVYVPRWQSEQLARRAAERLPEGGTAIDLCTGSGAVAAVMMSRKPQARVLAVDLDPKAVNCARTNGVEAYPGALLDPIRAELHGSVDVVVGVVPYVPTSELPLLQRDTFSFESTLSYDGGTDGLLIVRQVLSDSTRFLRIGGALLLELGGTQAAAIRPDLVAAGYGHVQTLLDEDGDVRGVEATFGV